MKLSEFLARGDPLTWGHAIGFGGGALFAVLVAWLVLKLMERWW